MRMDLYRLVVEFTIFVCYIVIAWMIVVEIVEDPGSSQSIGVHV